MTKTELIDFLDSIRDYERESHNMIGFDERTSEEFVDQYLASHPSEKETELSHHCDGCKWKDEVKYDCLCPDACDDITDRYEPKETERSCSTCIDKRDHGITENCKTCDQFTYSNWKPITTP